MHMMTTKLVIIVLTLVVLCASAAYVEYGLLLRLGIAFALFATTSGLAVLLGALRTAPEGWEDAGGFHTKRAPAKSARSAVHLPIELVRSWLRRQRQR